MATPHVAGAAALLLGANPTATPADVRSSLVSAATPDVLSDVKDGSPNLLLFTPPADEVESTTAVTTVSTTAPSAVPSTTTSATTVSTMAATTVPSMTTSATTISTTAPSTFPSTTTSTFFGGGDSCHCECVCQCQLGSSASAAALNVSTAEDEGLVSSGVSSNSGSTGSVTAFAGGGLAAVAFIGMSSGVGYMVGRRAGVEPEQIQPPQGREQEWPRVSVSTFRGAIEDLKSVQ